ncbi:MAG: ABC transporter ATP-binding protein [Acidobacteriota bacterium]
MSDNAITALNVSKTFRFLHKREVRALAGVDLVVPRGCALGVVGPNGAGKTTLLKILLGLLRPDRGEIQLFGAPPTACASKPRIGYLPELFSFHSHMTGRALLLLLGRCSEIDKESLSLSITQWSERLELSHALDRPFGSYSNGMKRRIGLIQAVLAKPDLLVLDEPLSGVDPAGRELIFDSLVEERRRGATTIMSSHVIPDVERACERLVMIGSGSVLLEGQITDLVAMTDETWELTVTIARQEQAVSIGAAGYELAHFSPTLARVVCNAGRRDTLERLLRDLDVRIVGLAPGRRRLEDVYRRALDASA